jgi:hypothetical protein
MSGTYDYGLWGLVAFHIGVFVLFGLGLLQPASRREWRSMGAFMAFVVALYTEMYGFPLTIYLLTAWLGGFRPPNRSPMPREISGRRCSSALGRLAC